MYLRGEALQRELAELTPTPTISDNSKAMTRHLEPFFKRLPHLAEDHRQRIESKRRQFQDQENELSTFSPEISLTANRMDRSVNGLLEWGKERDMRNEQKRQEREAEQRASQPFKPRLSKRTQKIAARMPRSQNDGCRATARAEAAETASQIADSDMRSEVRSEATFQPSIDSRSARLYMGEESVHERLYRQARSASHAPSESSYGGQEGEGSRPGSPGTRPSSRGSSRAGSMVGGVEPYRGGGELDRSMRLASPARGRHAQPAASPGPPGGWMVGPPAKQDSVQRGAADLEDYSELDAPASAVDNYGHIASDYDKRYESIYRELWQSTQDS